MSFHEPVVLGRTGLMVGRLGIASGYGAPARAVSATTSTAESGPDRPRGDHTPDGFARSFSVSSETFLNAAATYSSSFFRAFFLSLA